MTAKKTNWLERAVTQMPCLCLSEQALEQAMADIGDPDMESSNWVSEGCNATANTLTDKETGEVVCVVVCLRERKENEDPIELLGVIAHEAVHVIQKADKTGTDVVEYDAMAQQVCFMRLAEEYCRQKGKELVFRNKRKKGKK